MNNIELSTETIKLIRKSIRERLADCASAYMIRKVIKHHVENPCKWSAGKEADNSEEECIKRYYRNISNNIAAENIFLHFQNSVLCDFGIRA